mgnify:CR=1 FL=1
MVAPAALAAGGQLLGGVMGKRSASKARRQAKAEQASALAFQARQQKLRLQQLDFAQKGGMERIMAAGEGRIGDTLSNMVGKGFGIGSAVGQGMLRSTKMDTRNAIGQLAANIAQQRAGVFAGGETSYPMIQPQAQGGQGAGTANMLQGLMGLFGSGGAGAGPSLTLPMGLASNYGAMTGRAPGAMGQWGGTGGGATMPTGFSDSSYGQKFLD